MAFYLIIRGPLGVGKSTVSARLAKAIHGAHVSIDRILDEQGLWESGRLSEFLRANTFAIDRARKILARGTPVIFDGNFYWRSQIEDLIGRLDDLHHVVTLRAPLKVCIERDAQRHRPHGREAAREVYAKVTRFEIGIAVDARGSPEAVVRKILSRLDLDEAGSGLPRRRRPASHAPGVRRTKALRTLP